MLPSYLMYSYHYVFETGTMVLDKDCILQRSQSTTLSSKTLRGFERICIALRNIRKMGKNHNDSSSKNVADMRLPGRYSVQKNVNALAKLKYHDLRHTIPELARTTEITHTIVLYFLKEYYEFFRRYTSPLKFQHKLLLNVSYNFHINDNGFCVMLVTILKDRHG